MLLTTSGGRGLELVEGDITRISVDAIVNPANSALAGGGGVDGAIHAAGGPEIMRELAEIRTRIGRCPAGGAVATSAGRLPAKFVFHAVGPIYRNSGEEAALLESCYVTCLDMAAERSLATISFPSISTGVYGYPLQEAARVALTTVVKWLNRHSGSVNFVKLVQFSAGDHKVYTEIARREQSGLTNQASS